MLFAALFFALASAQTPNKPTLAPVFDANISLVTLVGGVNIPMNGHIVGLARLLLLGDRRLVFSLVARQARFITTTNSAW